ncbi:hypothetical protein NNO07_21490 [Pseudomonas resinovorans]|uniref:Uncharacterized protein n=1 Tax=Metapseudomonas resinovorans TaxID=53412 RepID=A0ABT4YAP8_METRE|nr:hypothetical protein [Pseudomonas resinovorans]MDA8485650.1 hypothetical protein [Pseudomonas resinovorans]
MNNSKLEIICGVKISDISLIDNDAGIVFENGCSPSIYNKFTLSGINKRDEKILIGRKITKINEDAQEITMTLEGNFMITINMRDNAYSGPEALQLRIPGNPIVIWN